MDQDRSRDFRRKKYPPFKDKDEKPMKRPIILMKSKDNSGKVEDPPPQTILLKTRDGEKRAVSPHASTSKTAKETEATPSYQIASRVPPPDLGNLLAGPPLMKESVKLLEDGSLQILEGLVEFLTDSTDFLVIGCLGTQGVGKSTLMSHLANPSSIEPVVFKKQTNSQVDSGSPGTTGIDAFVTPERIILLDTQPLLSVSIIARYYANEPATARSSRDDPEYPCVENDIELLSLQYAAFLLTICHVVLLIQEQTLNFDLSRFIQIAEMLKPSSGLQSDDDAFLEYFPHTVFIHTKSPQSLFNKEYVRKIQETYKQMYSQSQLPIQSGIGIANGNVLRSLTPDICDCEPINFFVLPMLYRKGGVYEIAGYNGLLKALRYQLFGLAPAALTNTVLSEKNWYYYAIKIWDVIKKNPLFPEYGRLLPTASSVAALEPATT